MKVWGLTGNIACGKSAVESMLRDAGIPVIDADAVSRQVVEPGQPALEAVAEAFGPGVIGADGRLDRPALGRIVFSDPEARRRLEAITHPAIAAAIGARIRDLAAKGQHEAVVSAALMVESGSYRAYGGLLVVTCPPDLQLQRLLARDDLSEAEARARVVSQLPQERKAALADRVFDNSGDLEGLREQVGRWLSDRPR